MKINIGDFQIDDGSSVLIIAELSANHNHDMNLAIETIKAAKKAGADAIKLQTYTPDTITIDCDNEYFQIRQGTLWDGQTLYNLYKQAYTPWEWHETLFKTAHDEGLICFSSPFDFTAVDFLEQFNPPAYKIASFEITDIPLIEYVAKQQRPVIISTGIATFEEINEAVDACHRNGNHEVALLKCTSAYPAPFNEINLRTIPDMFKTFNTITGISDHTLGIETSIAAVALGAKIVEKHFILDREMGGPDAAFSMIPGEFKQMVSAIRNVELALGEISYELTPKVQKSREHARSLFVIKDIRKGEVLTEENIRSIRPGYGLPPKFLPQVIGKAAKRNLKRGEPLNFEMF